MELACTIDGKRYTADLDSGRDISIRLQNWPDQPNAFHAPPFQIEPFRSGTFIGAISEGSPVNFFNFRLNPHGNATHTECAGHILELDWSVTDSLQSPFFTATLLSIYPELLENGDRTIRKKTLQSLLDNGKQTDALILRTMPNPDDKCHRKYSGSNPPYFELEAMQWIREAGYLHLLTDLPSVDREEDSGKLLAHHCFWETDKKTRKDKTITELIFVENSITDGLYLIDIQVLNISLDASPSRPVLYPLEKRP